MALVKFLASALEDDRLFGKNKQTRKKGVLLFGQNGGASTFFCYLIFKKNCTDMKQFIRILTLAICLFAGTALSAQSVDEILDKYFQAVGSPDAWASKKNMKIIGSSENMGMTFPVTVYSMRPNLQKVEVNIQGQQYVESFDGEVAWTINPFMGSSDPVKKTEDETKEAAKNMFEDEFINWKEKGHQVTVEGKEEVDGTETIKVKLVKKSGDETFYFFDPESYVPIMMRSFINAGPMKGTAIDSYSSDYQEVGDVMVPFSLEQKTGGQTIMNMKITKVEFNVPLDEKAFKMPGK